MFSKIASLFYSTPTPQEAAPEPNDVFLATGPLRLANDNNGRGGLSMVTFSATAVHAAQRDVTSASSRDYDSLLKMIVIGASGSGKSSLIQRMSSNTFSTQYKSTIGVDFAIKVLHIGSRVVKLQLWDTSGQERFRSISTSYYRGANGVLAVFNCDSRASFEDLPRSIEEAQKLCSEGTPIMVVLAKNDLPAVVSEDEARAWAERAGCMFASTSSKLDAGVFDAFAMLAQRAMGVDGAADVRSGSGRVVARSKLDASNIIMRVELDKLGTASPLVTGEPVRCRSCGALMSALSRVEWDAGARAAKATRRASKPLEMAPPIVGAFDVTVANEAPATATWDCEYCDHVQAVAVTAGELAELQAAGPCVDYLVSSAPKAADADDTSAAGAAVGGAPGTVLFVIDVSGSMSTTSEVPHAGRRGRAQHVTRLQLLQSAIAAQIEALAKADDSVRVGIITFASVVTLYGDGTQPCVVLSGTTLDSWAELSRIEWGVASPLSASKAHVLRALQSLTEGGQTALGPAMLLAINAAGANASVVLATDGMANAGLGDTANKARRQDALDYYVELGERCRVKGITCNILSIKGADCELSALETMVTQSRGTLNRIDPTEAGTVVAQALKKTTVASTVLAMTCLHRGLRYVGECDDEAERRNWLVKDAGTVHAGDTSTFRIGLRSKDDCDLTHHTAVPVQLQLLFTRPDGDTLVRVVTSSLPLARDADAVKPNASVIATYAAQNAAQQLQRGDLAEAQAVLLDAQQVAIEATGERMSELDVLQNQRGALGSDEMTSIKTKLAAKSFW